MRDTRKTIITSPMKATVPAPQYIAAPRLPADSATQKLAPCMAQGRKTIINSLSDAAKKGSLPHGSRTLPWSHAPSTTTSSSAAS